LHHSIRFTTLQQGDFQCLVSLKSVPTIAAFMLERHLRTPLTPSLLWLPPAAFAETAVGAIHSSTTAMDALRGANRALCNDGSG